MIAAGLALLLIACTFLTGCVGGPLTPREHFALSGTLLGAGTGALIGAATGHAPWKGAAIGAGAGALGGALIGDDIQRQQQAYYGYGDSYYDDHDYDSRYPEYDDRAPYDDYDDGY